MKRDIYGLVLVGGESRRMGRDKALLSYDGEQTQLERTVSLLNQVCAASFVSMRQDQSFPIPATATALYDGLDTVKGPLCGILSAMKAKPDADWLVIACDLPFLDVETLQALIDAYQSKAPALTAYRSAHDELPEPLCAIYPSGSDTALMDLAQEIGKFCPRKLLILKEAKLVDLLDPRSLDNINTSDEFENLSKDGYKLVRKSETP
jgi:Molybdopterin-guanine dinucleotide biosynthesis protein A